LPERFYDMHRSMILLQFCQLPINGILKES